MIHGISGSARTFESGATSDSEPKVVTSTGKTNTCAASVAAKPLRSGATSDPNSPDDARDADVAGDSRGHRAADTHIRRRSIGAANHASPAVPRKLSCQPTSVTTAGLQAA